MSETVKLLLAALAGAFTLAIAEAVYCAYMAIEHPIWFGLKQLV